MRLVQASCLGEGKVRHKVPCLVQLNIPMMLWFRGLLDKGLLVRLDEKTTDTAFRPCLDTPFGWSWSLGVCFIWTTHFVFATRSAARRWFGDAEDDADEYQIDERDQTACCGVLVFFAIDARLFGKDQKEKGEKEKGNSFLTLLETKSETRRFKAQFLRAGPMELKEGRLLDIGSRKVGDDESQLH